MRVTSPFGWRVHPVTGERDFHAAIDLAAATGTPVRAAWAGRVAKLGTTGAGGLSVSLDHGHQVRTYYAHLSRFLVALGQLVQRGQSVGLSGSTGQVTGPHLHFAIFYRGNPVNPCLFLPPWSCYVRET